MSDKGGFWDHLRKNPFGGLFDLNKDGREDIGEQWIAHNVVYGDGNEKKPANTYNTSHYGSVPSLDSEDDSWRDDADDGSDYGLDPEDFETEEEYEEALDEAKYSWRDDADDGSDYGLDPEDYETEEEYEEALDEAKYSWRDTADDGIDYGLDPEDFETEEEYEEALDDARNNW